jgi:acyltransferase
MVGVDLMKGLLMILVIYGHIIQGMPSDDIVKWIIYGFHMPAFFFLSGFLLSTSSLLRRSVKDQILKYSSTFLAWLLLSLLYNASFIWDTKSIPSIKIFTKDIIFLFLYPSFHLWFIPALFGMIAVTYFTARSKSGNIVVFIVSLLLTISVPVYATALLPGKILWILGDKRVYVYFFYFFFGFLARDQMPAVVRITKLLRYAWPIIAPIAAAVYIFTFYKPVALVISLSVLCINLCLLSFFPQWALLSSTKSSASTFLSWIGRHSLFIYLLHPFVTNPLVSIAFARRYSHGFDLIVLIVCLAILYLIKESDSIPAQTPISPNPPSKA